MKESTLQKQIIEYLSLIAQSKKIFYFSIPNESLMAAMQMFNVPEMTRYKMVAHFKKLGLVSGIPDLCILYRGQTLFVELKRPGGKVSDQQKLIHVAIKKSGHNVEVVYSLEDFQDVLFIFEEMVANEKDTC